MRCGQRISKNVNRKFTEEIWIVSKDMSKCSVSLVMEIQTKTTNFTLVRTVKMKTSDGIMLARMWSHRDTCTLLVNMYVGTTYLKNNLTITSNVEVAYIPRAVNSTSWFLPLRYLNMYASKQVEDTHTTLILIARTEPIQMSINWRMDNLIMMYSNTKKKKTGLQHNSEMKELELHVSNIIEKNVVINMTTYIWNIYI